MERDYKLLLAIGVLVFAVVSFVYAAHTATTPDSGDTTTSFSLNESVVGLFNITINNTNAGQDANITQVNITFSSSTFTVNGTNGTNTLYSSVTNTSNQFSWINSTAYLINGSINNSYFWFYASSNTPGTYNLTVRYLNGTTAAPIVTSTNLTVTINDTTYPEITIVNPSNNSNLSSATLDLNYTYIEAYPGFCWYSNNSGVVNSSYLAMGTNLTGVVTWTEGLWNVTVWCNDTQNNVNSTMVRFRIDTTNPSVSYSCSPTTISFGGIVTCTCSISDSGSGVETFSYTESPDTQLYGSQTISCSATDYAGNSASDSVTYYITAGGGGGGGGGYSGYVNTFVEDAKEFNEIGEITKSLGGKNRIRIKINNQEHYIGVKELTTTSATIEVSSTPQEVVFNIGDEKKFDVTEDGYYDLKVKLNSIESEKADITITSINEKIPEDKDKGMVEKTIDKITKEGSTWIWILVVIVLVVIIVIYFLKKKK